MEDTEDTENKPIALPYVESTNQTEQSSEDRYEACLKMDELGPMIINSDGSIQRIANWGELTKEEQANTFRLICARNKKRIELLKRKEEEEAKAAQQQDSSEKVHTDENEPSND